MVKRTKKDVFFCEIEKKPVYRKVKIIVDSSERIRNKTWNIYIFTRGKSH